MDHQLAADLLRQSCFFLGGRCLVERTEQLLHLAVVRPQHSNRVLLDFNDLGSLAFISPSRGSALLIAGFRVTSFVSAFVRWGGVFVSLLRLSHSFLPNQSSGNARVTMLRS